jgi:hypothetical protein
VGSKRLGPPEDACRVIASEQTHRTNRPSNFRGQLIAHEAGGKDVAVSAIERNDGALFYGRLAEALCPEGLPTPVYLGEESAVVPRLRFSQGLAIEGNRTLEYADKRDISVRIDRQRARLLLVWAAKAFGPLQAAVGSKTRQEDVCLIAFALDFATAEVNRSLEASCNHRATRGFDCDSFRNVVVGIPEATAPYVSTVLVELCKRYVVPALG